MQERFKIGQDRPVTPNYDFSSDMRTMKRTMQARTEYHKPFYEGQTKRKVIPPDKPIQPERGTMKYKHPVGGSMI